MGATPEHDCFVAGSIRREKVYIGDIDIVLISEHERDCISKLATARLLPQSVTEQQDRVIYRFNIAIEKASKSI